MYDGRPPRIVAISQAIVRPFVRSGYFRQDGSFMALSVSDARQGIHVKEKYMLPCSSGAAKAKY